MDHECVILEVRDDMTKRIAGPMVGDIVASFLLELPTYPVIYVLSEGWGELRIPHRNQDAAGK